MLRRWIGKSLIKAGFFLLLVAIILATPPGRALQLAPELLGLSHPQTSLVLLQNHTELRPTGGFMGSYATFTLDRGHLTELTVQDIYVPDGQVTAHIDPPPPIQSAFQLGTWRLRDANWNPNFPTAARDILWFMAKAGQPPADTVIATNSIVFENLLELVGPIELPDYHETITADNLWEKTQQHSQTDSFPGSKQKQEFLSDLAAAARDKLERSPLPTKIRTVALAWRMLDEKHIAVASNHPPTQKLLHRLHWDGAVRPARCPSWLPRCQPDSLFLVEANLGVNKANCCLTRELHLAITHQGDRLAHELTLTLTNSSSPHRWGGPYRAQVRAITPLATESFWTDLPTGETRDYTTSYHLPTTDPRAPLALLVQKQSGIEKLPLTVSYTNHQGKTTTKTLKLTKDTTLILN